MDIEKIRHVLLYRCALHNSTVDGALPGPIVVGVSGGPDSLCLLDILHRLEYSIIVAHLDHNLRPESGEDARYVQSIATNMGIAVVVQKHDVAAFAQNEKLSIEEAARVARYGFLFALAREHSAAAVAVAHSADDQAETVLMHLLRGSGLAGLRGMAYRIIHPDWDDNIPLIRPLLGNWREEIEAYCDDRQLQPVIDASNQDTVYYRNRLRHELIPYLQSYNPKVKEVVWRMAQSLEGDYQVLDEVVQQAWKHCHVTTGIDYVKISLQALRSMSKGLQRNILRKAIFDLREQLRDVSFDSIDRAIAFIAEPSQSRRMDLISNLQLMIEGEYLYIAEWGADIVEPQWPQIPGSLQLELPVPGRIVFPNSAWQLGSEILTGEGLGSLREKMGDPYQAWLDMDKVLHPLVVRSRQPGDRFQPLGMKGRTMKLSDFWVNVKLPRHARDGWPLVCSDGKIVWVPGYRLSHPYRLLESSLRVLHLQLKHV